MLKTFRRIFAQRTPVEFEVYRREKTTEPESSLDTNIATTEEASSSNDSGILEAVAGVRTDLERQVTAHEQLATSLSQIEPLGRRVTQRLDAIGGTERHLAELVHEFNIRAASRDEALQSTMGTMNVTAERQMQVLSVLQEQIDRSQNSMQELAQRFAEVGGGIDSLLIAQRTTADHTAELVSTVRDQVKAISLQQRRTFMITIAVLSLAAIALVVAIILAAV